MMNLEFLPINSVQDDFDVLASVTSPTRVHQKKDVRKPITDREQFNTATFLFRKIAETLSALTESEFSDKMRLFVDLHALIRTNQPIELLLNENAEKTLSSIDGQAMEIVPQECPSPVSENRESSINEISFINAIYR
jgi:hypothetical protein